MSTENSIIKNTWVDLLQKISIVGLLGFILFGGYSGVWVWGTQFTEVKKERDEWKNAALHGLNSVREVSSLRPIFADKPTNELSPAEVIEQAETLVEINK